MDLRRTTTDATRNSIGLLLVLLLAMCLAISRAHAVPPPQGVAPVLPPPGGLAIDGDLLANTPATNTGDWIIATNNAPPGTGGAVLGSDGAPLNPITTFHLVDGYKNGGTDLVFAGGLKWNDNPNTWSWTTGSASAKTDINNVLLHLATDPDGHHWAVMAADRLSTSGDSYIDFEILQNTLTRASNGAFSSSGPHGGRTLNDLVLSLAFTGGGKVADFFVWQWRTNGSGGYHYVDVTAAVPAGRVFAALNTNSIAVPYGAFGSTNYAPNAFGEAALDLTALLGSFDPCMTFGVRTILVKTKSSASDTASIEDFIDPIQYSLQIGPRADAGPDQSRCSEGESTAFILNGTAERGLYAVVSTTWSVVDGNVTIDATNSLITTAHVASATATLRLTVVQANGCTETDDIVLTVKPLPNCAITGSAVVCPRSTNTFSAPAGMNSYSWSVSGNAAINGPTNQSTVTVATGNTCSENFTLSLIVISNGCASACTLEVLASDTTLPTITCPADRVLECPADTRTNFTGVATATDDCGLVTVGYADAVTNGCGGTRIVARTWTATDGCGNTATCIQTITIRDTVKPLLTCPPNLSLECPADTGTNATGVATAQDACGTVVVQFADSVATNCGGTRVIARTWTATDECGNASTCVQTITVRDSTPPQITCPTNVVLEAPADTGTNATGVATATDACGTVTIQFSDSVSNSCGNTRLITRTWTATDECGNTSSCIQNITVRDTTAPTLTCPPDLVLECPADTGTNATGVATASDAAGQATIGFSDTVTNQCGATRTIIRTWTATDECGNSVSCQQNIAVRDTTPPVITCPPNLVLECPADTRTNATGVATATDACSAVSITFSDAVSNGCAGAVSIIRTWTATDACGNASSCDQTIAVRDTTPPTITCPPNRVLECPADTAPAATGTATASDACSTVSVTHSDALTNGCAGTRVTTRTWTAIDACGNSSSCVQTITVRDTTPPVITCPIDRVLECPADTGTNATGIATATDGCGTATVQFSDSVSNQCGSTRIITRTWTATDECGNASSCVQTVTVRDTIPPVITCPVDRVLECPADTRTNATGVATATDACSSATVTFSDAVTNGCGGTKVIRRTWTATDECGNASSCAQTITVRDTTPPVITCPANLVLECPAFTTTNATGIATASDACGSVTIAFSDASTNGCAGTTIIARTWTATDECGNVSSCVQTIAVRDTTPPTITCPVSLILECPADTGTNATGVASGSDTCGSVAITHRDAVTTNCGGTVSIVRTWTATDTCGNASSCAQTITVRDTTPPTITCPANLVLECPAVTTTNVTGVATAQDGCSQATVTYSDSVSNACAATKTILRTWRAVDACGNSSSCIQTITVRDTLPPALTLPAALTLECGASTAPASTGTASAADVCGSATVSFSDIVSNACAGTRIISRRWTALDSCGNSTNAVQTITVRDTTPPTITLPANRVLDCPGDTRTNVTGVATATDVCGSVVVSYSDVVSNACGATKTVWRLWTATDQCGNSTNGLQTITVADTKKPTITCPSVAVQCVDDVPAPYASLAAFRAAGGTASDSCDTDLEFSMTSAGVLTGRCPGTVTRVYRVTDDCGNFAECTQTIVVSDTIAPTITCPPPLTVACGSSLDPAITGRATATDNCSTNIGITHGDAIVPSTYDINWYASDPVANSAPYLPTYLKFGPGSLLCPNTGRAADPLRNAVAYGPTAGQLDALTSLGGEPMALGQVVPFQAVIDVSGGPGPEHGTIEFTTTWSTHTTSNDEFGYDKNYKVYCAFVDYADPGSVDPQNNARVVSFNSTIINTGTSEEKIQGTFRISGLDTGDRVVVEVWVVLMSTQPSHVGGTIAADLVSAQKVLTPPQPISTGAKTISIGNLNRLNQLPPPQSQPPLPPLPPQPPIEPGFITSVIDRTWTATDDCGNQRSCTQRLTIRDAMAPALVVPADLVLEFPANTGTNVTGVATAQDVCGNASVTYSDTVSNGCGVARTISRVWTATDEWGNTTNATQTIAVRDTAPPIFTCPANLTLECPADTGTTATGIASATDASGPVAVSHSDVLSSGCGGARTITRTWTAVDTCGNTSTCTQTIVVRDTTPPLLSCPQNLVLECPADTRTNATGIATASDACGGAVSISFSDIVSNGCGSSLSIARTWTAADACGNTSTCVQTIVVRDTTPPTLTCSADKTVNAGENWTFDQPLASDTCGTAVLNVIGTVSNTAPSGALLFTRMWEALDACGNRRTCSQTVTVLPPAAPAVIELLTIAPDRLMLRWPLEPAGLEVQWADEITSTNWTPMPVTPFVLNGLNCFEFNPDANRRFYRLHRPAP